MYPTDFQRKVFWQAITAFSFLTIGTTVWIFGWLVREGINLLNPVLIPMATACILAYLLNPVVAGLQRLRFSRLWAVITVFVALLLIIGGIVAWVGPALWNQGVAFGAKMPGYIEQVHTMANDTRESWEKYSSRLLGASQSEDKAISDAAAQWLQKTFTKVIEDTRSRIDMWEFMRKNIGGVFGALGVMLSLVLVPIFLFFILWERPNIGMHWNEYLPLRTSAFKEEVVSLLTEINGYLISFFRGQFLVSMIDGIITGFFLLMMGLEFALLIGLMICVLALIPYIGIFLCWVPAVIIAIAQFGDWQHPLLVTVIFVGVNYLEGIFISPKILGDSVGLHPFTVILSVLAWGVVFGGILGALLAVPLTATFKVVLKRYFWDMPVTDMESPAVSIHAHSPKKK